MARVAAAVVAPAVAAVQTVPAAAAAAAAVAAAAVAHSEHAAAAAAVVAAVAVTECESLDDARSCFRGGALPLLGTQRAQWRGTGGCCHHLHSADAEEDHLPGTELERV